MTNARPGGWRYLIWCTAIVADVERIYYPHYTRWYTTQTLHDPIRIIGIGNQREIAGFASRFCEGVAGCTVYGARVGRYDVCTAVAERAGDVERVSLVPGNGAGDVRGFVARVRRTPYDLCLTHRQGDRHQSLGLVGAIVRLLPAIINAPAPESLFAKLFAIVSARLMCR